MVTERIQFAPRSHQVKTWAARQNGCKRFVERIHRRYGKDRNWLNITFQESQKRVGNYAHVFPTLNQGRHDIWDNTFLSTVNDHEVPVKLYDPTGQFHSIFPPEFVRTKDENQMQIEFINGSMWQILGADDERAIARLRGQNGLGYVLSEYAFQNPKVWTTLEPVLLENGGWVAFISTPNVEGDDFDRLCDFAQVEPGWFYQALTIEDTRKDAPGENGAPVVSQADIDSLRRQGRREEEIQREYYCNNKGYRHGTIYGDLISAAEAGGRIGTYSYNAMLPVGTSWDLGYSRTDAMAVWFYQRPNPTAIYFIDYMEELQKDLRYMTHALREKKPYLYGRLCLPHDGKASAEFLETMRFINIEVADRPQSVQDQIDATRRIFHSFHFDRNACARGIECLAKFKYEWDPERRVFTGKPVHDEYSHGARAIDSAVSVGFDPLVFPNAPSRELKVESTFDPREP